MTYHFQVHAEDGFWAECIELEGCVTQGKNRNQLDANMREALALYLEERKPSTVLFPPPHIGLSGARIAPVEVEPSVAFAVQLRQRRLNANLTQREAAQLLGMRSLYSYQRLERRANPSLRMMKKVKQVFPEFSMDEVLGGGSTPAARPRKLKARRARGRGHLPTSSSPAV